jgi:hypothetical protein
MIPNENQSPNVTKNNNSKKYPFSLSKFGEFSRKIWEYSSEYFSFFLFGKKIHPNFLMSVRMD